MSLNEIDCKTAFQNLKILKNHFLVDVRSVLEWGSDGIPDVDYKKNNIFFIEWDMNMKESFLNTFGEIINSKFKKSDVLYFICRSGIRSGVASSICQNIGFKNSYNVTHGYKNCRFILCKKGVWNLKLLKYN